MLTQVEKILAENHKKMQEERAQLDGHQIVLPIVPVVQPAVLSVEENQDETVPEDSAAVEENDEYKGEVNKIKGSEQVAVRGKGRGRGRGRGRGKGGDSDRAVGQEVKGRGRGKKNADGEAEGATRGEEGVRGKARGRGRGKVITVVTTSTLLKEGDGQASEDTGGLKECDCLMCYVFLLCFFC